MCFYKTSSAEDFERRANELLMGSEGVVLDVCVSPCVWTGQLPTLDEACAKEEGIPVARGQYLAGSIVCFPGDVSVCVSKWGLCDYGERLMKDFSAFLSGFADVQADGNDLLADGKKVFSHASALLPSGWSQTVAHFSVNCDEALIRRLCRKEQRKTPGALAEIGIDTESVLRFLSANGYIT